MIGRRITFWCAGLLALLAVSARAAESGDTLEAEVRGIVEGQQVTVVHFWAPWCPNCKAEMAGGGWAKFLEKNPSVRVVFLNVWHKGQDPAARLAAGKLGGQPNFVARTHPNESNTRGEKLEQFLGYPLQWVPTTWVYRAGKLRYALNYGEVRFDMLQQMIEDTQQKW